MKISYETLHRGRQRQTGKALRNLDSIICNLTKWYSIAAEAIDCVALVFVSSIRDMNEHTTALVDDITCPYPHQGKVGR